MVPPNHTIDELMEYLSAVAGFIRHTLFNDAPVVPEQEITLVLGPTEVSGPIKFNGSDADGDPLTYEVASTLTGLSTAR